MPQEPKQTPSFRNEGVIWKSTKSKTDQISNDNTRTQHRKIKKKFREQQAQMVRTHKKDEKKKKIIIKIKMLNLKVKGK